MCVVFCVCVGGGGGGGGGGMPFVFQKVLLLVIYCRETECALCGLAPAKGFESIRERFFGPWH